jgi:arginyl-tRNA synthetase
LWLGESDSQNYTKPVIDFIKNKKMAYESEGALIVDVAKADDKKVVPPFMLVKSDGSVLYSTTDLATIVQREKELGCERAVYVVDNRQDMHFLQLFRCVEKTGILSKPMQLEFAGFGTMNGKDGKPYKTRDGGVMRLSYLIEDVTSKAKEKINIERNSDVQFSEKELENISQKVAIAALKFADLSIYRAKDYVFDLDKFSSFEGKTGPYLLYTITRAKSILAKQNYDDKNNFAINITAVEKPLALILSQFGSFVKLAYENIAPSYLCDYAYKLADAFNNFYAKNSIIKQDDLATKNSWLKLTSLCLNALQKTLDLLGIETLERM